MDLTLLSLSINVFDFKLESQAPQHFRSPKKQATFEGYFARSFPIIMITIRLPNPSW